MLLIFHRVQILGVFIRKPSNLDLWFLIQLFMNSKIFTIGKNRNNLNIICKNFTPGLTPFLNCFRIQFFYNRPFIAPFRIQNSVNVPKSSNLSYWLSISTYWAKASAPLICASWSGLKAQVVEQWVNQTEPCKPNITHSRFCFYC